MSPHALMCEGIVHLIHTMEDDQRLHTLVHEGGDTLRSTLYYCKKVEKLLINTLYIVIRFCLIIIVCLSLEQVDELLRGTTDSTSEVREGVVPSHPPAMSEREKAHLLQEYDCTEDDTIDITRYIM